MVVMLVALIGCSSTDDKGEPGGGARSTQDGTRGGPSSGGGGSHGQGREDDASGGDWRGGSGEDGRDWQPTAGGDDQGGSDWTGDEDGGNGDDNGSSGSSDRDKQEDIAWLPWGPKSPTTQTTTDARHAYDLLQAGRCQEAMDLVHSWGSDRLSWRVIEGLAGACLATQGRQDGWDIAVAAHEKLSRAGYQPDPGWCKEGDAYATLKRLTAFHRDHPKGRVRLVENAPGVMACDSGVTGVSFYGGGEQVGPGDQVTVDGTWPSKPTAVVLSWSGGRSKTVKGAWSEGSACCEKAQLYFTFPDDLDGRPYSVILEVVGKDFRLGYQQPLVINWPSPAP
ncbi:hypothetical protein GR925_21000 [Streptomyces sp. HUCO-GS316]|uniref:hypothetical protein n=1 Tax=Streptomyces sp. HUCO-GS316 TaxID=2692198 RepID=UPI0013685823|nr:hypothetical protein [Streptomyces sp. HUCO-GS316]MXM65860.1 hypothetical protein [Streptomyces sp. HUCO-GS316]